MNEKIIKYVIRIGIALFLTLVATLIALLLLNNLGGLVKLFNSNRYVTIFFNMLKGCEMKIPYIIIFIIFLLYLIFLILLKKENKIVMIAIIVIITIIGIISMVLLTTFDDNFLFQIIKNLKEGINEF